MGSCWDESNPSPAFTKPTFTPQQVLANSAGIAVAWEAELPHQPTQLHGQAVVKQVHQAPWTRRHIYHKTPHIMNQFVLHFCWFHCQLPCKDAQAQTNPLRSSHSTACTLPAWLSTAAHEWLTILVWLAPRHNHAPTLWGTLHITTLLIGIVWELYGTCNPINDRIMRLKPIDAEYNLAREVLAHITQYRQLQRAVLHAGSKE